MVKAELVRGTLRAARIGFLVGLCLAALYAVVGALGDTELGKSLGFSLLLVGFPTIFAAVAGLQWLGVQGGAREGLAVLFLTLSLNGALWGAVIGIAVALWPLAHRERIRPGS